LANDVKLQEGHPVDENLRPIKVGGKSTALETAQHGNGARVNGDLEVTGDIKGNIKDISFDKVSINRDILYPTTGVSESHIALNVDLDKEGASSNNNNIYGVKIDVDNTTATAGANGMFGINSSATLTHAADAGTALVTGASIKAIGDTNGTFNEAKGIFIESKNSDTVYGMILWATGGTTNTGIEIKCTDGGNDIKILSSADNGDYFLIQVTANGATTLTTVDDDGVNADLTLNIDGFIDLNSALGEDITLDAGGDITLDSASGNFIAKKAGTEFSAANASYAGMCLGYTTLLIDDAAANYAVTTTMTVVSDDHKVVFTAPPSGNVEIGVDVFADCASGGRWMVFGLSSQNATSGYLTVDNAHEHRASVGDETDEIYLHHRWTITGLTAGTEYTYWLGADAQSASVWVLRWGGTTPGLGALNYAPFIMKATALPATIYTG